MKKTMRSWNSTLRSESPKRRAARLSGEWKPKPRKPIRLVSIRQKKRAEAWRKHAEEVCTVDGVLYCALCGHVIHRGELWEAHHYNEKRGNAKTVENDKYVAALHMRCHRSIDHNDRESFLLARTRIIDRIKLWQKD